MVSTLVWQHQMKTPAGRSQFRWSNRLRRPDHRLPLCGQRLSKCQRGLRRRQWLLRSHPQCPGGPGGYPSPRTHRTSDLDLSMYSNNTSVSKPRSKIKTLACLGFCQINLALRNVNRTVKYFLSIFFICKIIYFLWPGRTVRMASI